MKLLHPILVISVLLRSSSEALPLFSLIEALSNYYGTKCVEILFNSNIPLFYHNNLWSILKNISSSQMTTAYLLEEYQSMKIIESDISLSRCNVPLRVAFARHDNHILYEKMSRWKPSKISRPISLVVMIGSSIEEFFRNASVPLHLLTFAAVFRSLELIELHAVFKVDSRHSLRVRKVGYWTPEKGVFIDSGIIKVERRNFEGKLFRIASTESWPYVTFRGSVAGNATWDGEYSRVWKTLEEGFNITSIQYEFAEVGVEKPDRTWTGMIGALLRRKVDAIVADLSITPERCRVVDFVNVFPFSTSYLYFQQIGSQLTRFVTLEPFQSDVWWALLFLWLSFVSCLCFAFHMYDKLGITPEEPTTYPDIAFFALRTCLVQGFNPALNTLTVKILCTTAYITTTVVLTAYSVYLIHFLSQENPRLPFDNIQGLLDDGTYKVLLSAESTYERYFANSTDEKKREVYRRLAVPFHQNYYSNESSTGLEALCSHQKVGLMESDRLINSKHLKHIGCKVRPLMGIYMKIPQGIAFRRDSPFSHAARSYINRMRETGLIQRSLRQLSHVVQNSDDSVKPIGLQQVYIIFVILMSGTLNAVFSLVLEIYYHSLLKRKNLAESQRLGKTA